jgi:myo-inositol catabolism protein IolC
MSGADNNRRINVMARTIRTKIYKFDELSNDAKKKAIEQFYDINVMDEWWQYTYEDAEQIGLKINEFDIDRASCCKGEFMLAANEVAQNILNNHGEVCETYKTATAFMEQWQPVFSAYMDETSDKYESRESENELQDIEDEFLKCLCEDYLVILRNEYEYQTSESAIIESIEANEYEFTKDGKQFS